MIGAAGAGRKKKARPMPRGLTETEQKARKARTLWKEPLMHVAYATAGVRVGNRTLMPGYEVRYTRHPIYGSMSLGLYASVQDAWDAAILYAPKVKDWGRRNNKYRLNVLNPEWRLEL